jgi:propionyl-CoA carboxylase beta chain
MGAEGAVNIIHRERIARAADPAATRRELTAAYEAQLANPYEAAARGYVDAVIEPAETRPRLIAALEAVHTKRDSNPPKKHGNIPL